MRRIGALLGAGGVLVALAATPAACVRAGDEGFAALSQSTFEALLHQSFYINSEKGIVVLDLVEVREREKSSKDPARKGAAATGEFSIVLVGPVEPVLPAAMYRLEHRLGNLNLFLEPAGMDSAGMRYSALFRLLR